MVTNSKRYMRMYMRTYRTNIRNTLLIAYGSQCALCGCSELYKLEFHHRNGYNGMLHPNGSRGGHENMLDVQRLIKDGRKDEIQLLCKSCHESIHGKRR